MRDCFTAGRRETYECEELSWRGALGRDERE